MNAEELALQLGALKTDLKERRMELLTATEKIAKEFLKLRLPVNSEILDIGAGTGVLSAVVQTQGFTNMDVLDEDLNTLRSLQALRLYRNYIWTGITGLNSTGLREGTYDVVVSADGIASQCISPTQLTELLRILRPGGILFLTMNLGGAAVEHRTSEFGLFDLNLASLEKEGKCNLMKKESLVDEGCIPIGEFYMVRCLASPLPEYLSQPVSRELEDAVTKILGDHSDPETRIKFYDSWSEKYDEDLVCIGLYTGHIKCVEAFLKLKLDHHVQILDIAAGTGLLGSEVGKHGYEYIDALDSSLGMLSKARKNGIYKTYIHATLDKLGSIPVKDEAYDVLLMTNGFAPGQIYPCSLPEMLRVLRPGGYMLWTMKDGFQTSNHQFSMMDSYIEDLVRQGSAIVLVGPVVFQQYIFNTDGRFYMLRKPHTNHWAVKGSPQDSPSLQRRN